MDTIDLNENKIREDFKISDTMQRESAIADDYWNYIFKHGKKDQVEVAIQNIERKLHDLQEQIHSTNNQVSNYDQQWFSSDP
ncbi:unnamed protein product [Rotaria sp. Silwood2]|nr:unnamed protein product [Rotaria sp. Silwood2]CAF2939117.1 unnamed protein product [Rotaria sp. Silwood2]CAF3075111.1 unnamed protein product [Rotaria sp. Silwood2]CAF3326446.1 unnamed protein product [Rotaria sp. Silwood2]CAF4082453.1 unnamed protein product [Rotaria sp. Silwood2]